MNNGGAGIVGPMANMRMDHNEVAITQNAFHLRLSIGGCRRSSCDGIQKGGHSCLKVRIMMLRTWRDEFFSCPTVSLSSHPKEIDGNPLSILSAHIQFSKRSFKSS